MVTDSDEIVLLLDRIVGYHDAAGSSLRRSLRPGYQGDWSGAFPDGEYVLHPSVMSIYSWHNGIDWEKWVGSGTPSLFPYFGEFGNFERQAELGLVMTDGLYGDENAPFWRPSWFTVFGGTEGFAVECHPDREYGSVWYSSLSGLNSRRAALSLQGLLTRVESLFDKGRFTYDMGRIKSTTDEPSAVLEWLIEA